jgi:mono/diheme cytochrome c family protein
MSTRRTAFLIGVLILASFGTMSRASGRVQQTAGPQAGRGEQKALLDRYCLTCHTQRQKDRGVVPIALDNLDIANPSANAEIWEKVIRKVRAGVMPPASASRPDPAATRSFVSWLETELDRAAESHPNPGRPLIHRLNRTEYANAIHDLLDLDIDAASLLPPDDAAYGFDNIADALGLSPLLQERYLSAAMKLGALAVGDPRVSPGSETYRIRQDLSQDQHLDGMPLGTTGGTRVRHNFPLDGEYVLQAKLYRTNLNIVRGLDSQHHVEFTVDGQRVHLASIGGKEDLEALFEKPTDTGDEVDGRLRVRVPVKAGPHDVAVAFVDDSQALRPERLQRYLRSSVDNFDWSGQPHIQTFAITGPFNAIGSGDTPSRRRIFTCRPANQSAEAACAKQIVSALSRRAYRRPVTNDDVQRAMAFFEEGRKSGGFEAGIEAALQRILASPQFVFRVERDPDNAGSNAYTVSEVDFASRLSFFLWSSIPDDRLLAAASDGSLKRGAALEREVRRMLADSKSNALVENFAGQWLRLRNVRNVLPNSDLFPDFDDNLRQSFRRETELFFESIIREDRSVLDLLNADYSYINERLARHYGIPDVYGSRFRRVSITEPARRGLLGQGSILAVTSHAERTSPVLRGKWVLENILGLPVPPPPPDVPPLKERLGGEKPKTMREQMAEHRVNPACANCHKVMDGIGFSLENFDAVGAWRTTEAGGPIDASGELADGSKVNGVVQLRQALVAQPDLFVTTFSEKLLTYALGRGIDYHDMPAVRSIVRNAARNNYKFSAIVMGIIRSTPFQMRMLSQRETQETADVRR